MKKRTTKLLLLILVLSIAIPVLAACKNKERTIVVYNWEEYVNENVIKDFEKAYNAKVEYVTFSTNETMMTNIVDGKQKYDLVCPSDYAIQQLKRKDLLEPMDESKLSAYLDNVSKALDNNNKKEADLGKFDEFFFGEGGDANRYAVGYMWGLMGILYNVEKVASAGISNVESWGMLFDSSLKNQVYMKNSIRDSFAAIALYSNAQKGGPLTPQQVLRNDDNSLLDDIKRTFNAQKTAVAPLYEVDEAKNELAEGRYAAALMWSGDAYASMLTAEENGRELDFALPTEGNNIFCDGFVIPKNDKRSEEKTNLIYDFLNFISRPENAVRNMDEIGYTSVISGKSKDQNPIYDYAASSERYGIAKAATEENFFFGPSFGAVTVDPYLYPDADYIASKCAIMYDYGEKTQAFQDLWIELMAGSSLGNDLDRGLEPWAIALIIIAGALVVLGVAGYFIYRNKEKVLAIFKKDKKNQNGEIAPSDKNQAKSSPAANNPPDTKEPAQTIKAPPKAALEDDDDDFVPPSK